jgi:tetratricopeptide (TPR) repeat protein
VALPAEPAFFSGRRTELSGLRAELTRPGLTARPGVEDPEAEAAAGRARVALVAGRPGSGRTALAVRFARELAQAGEYPDGQFFVRMSEPRARAAAPVPAGVAAVAPERAARTLLAALGVPAPGLGEDACAALRTELTGRSAVLVLDGVQDAEQLLPLLPPEPRCLVVAVAGGPLTGVADVRPCALGGLAPAAGVAVLRGLAGDTRIVCDPVAAQGLVEDLAGQVTALRLIGGWLRVRPRASVSDARQALANATEAALAVARKEADAGSETGPEAGSGRKPGGGSGAGSPAEGEPASDGGAADGRTGVIGGAGAALDVGRAVQRLGGMISGRGGRLGERIAEQLVSRGLVTGAQLPSERLPEHAAEQAADQDAKARVQEGKGAGAERRAAPGAGELTPLDRAFAAVYAELPAASARLLRLLAAAPGGQVTARTASALVGCPVPEIEGPLRSLAEQELLRVVGPDPRGAGDVSGAADPGQVGAAERAGAAARTAPPADASEPRYELPACLRGRLAALLAGDRVGETELARARMLERLVRLLTVAVSMVTPPVPGARPPEELPSGLRFRSRMEAWDWLDQELPVLRAAARDAVAGGGLDGLAGRLIAALVRTIPVYAGGRAGVQPELYELHRLVLVLARRSGQRRREAAALVNLGDLDAADGRHRAALERFRAALGPARAADDAVAVGRILEDVAGAYRALGDLVRAADWYRRALGFRRNRGERADEARLLLRLAETHGAQQRYREALREYRAVVSLCRRLGDREGAVGGLLGASGVQELSGDVESALRSAREGVAGAGEDGRLRGWALGVLGDVLERSGDASGAKAAREA